MAIYLHYVRGINPGGGGGSQYVPSGCIQTTSSAFIGALSPSTSNDGNTKRGTNGSGSSGSTWAGTYDSTHGCSVIPSSDVYYIGGGHNIPLLPPSTTVTIYLYNNYSSAINNNYASAGTAGVRYAWDVGSSYSAYNIVTSSPSYNSTGTGGWYRHAITITTPAQPAYYASSLAKGYCILYFHVGTTGQNNTTTSSKLKVIFDVWDVGSNSQSFVNNISFNSGNLTTYGGIANNKLTVNLQNSLYPISYRALRTSNPNDSRWAASWLGNADFGSTQTTNNAQHFLDSEGELPTSGNSTNYKLQARLGANYGGMTSAYTWINHGDTFTLTNSGVTITQPTVNNTQSFNTTTTSATFSHSIALSSSGSGGTLQYNITQSSAKNTNNPSTTLPTSGWQTSNTFTLTRGYYYHFWARRSSGLGDRTNSSLQASYVATNLNATIASSLSIANAATSFDITVGNVSSNHTYRLGRNTSYGNITGTNSPYTTGTITSGSTATITIPNAASWYPSAGGSKTYYLYASRTSASGGSGDTGSFSSPGWYQISGEAITVSRGTQTGAGSLEITNSFNYGLEIRNGNNQVTFNPSVRNMRKLDGETFTISVPIGGSSTKTISGVTPSNDDEVAIIGGYAYAGFYDFSGVTIVRNQGSITFNNTSQYFAFTATFEVVRLG